MRRLLALLCILGILVVAPSSSARGFPKAELPPAGTLPGESFYSLKVFMEGVGNFFTFGLDAKTQRFLTLSGRRLAEVRAIVDTEPPTPQELDLIAVLLRRYESQLREALSLFGNVRDGGGDVLDSASEGVSQFSLHLSVFDGLESSLITQLREESQRVRGVAWEGLLMFLRGLERLYPLPTIHASSSVLDDRLVVLRKALGDGHRVALERAFSEVKSLHTFVESIGKAAEREEVARGAFERLERELSALQGISKKEAKATLVEEVRKEERMLFQGMREVLRKWLTYVLLPPTLAYTELLSDSLDRAVEDGADFTALRQDLLLLLDAIPFAGEIIQSVEGKAEAGEVGSLLLAELTQQILTLHALYEETEGPLKDFVLTAIVLAETERHRVWETLVRLGVKHGTPEELLPASPLKEVVIPEVERILGRKVTGEIGESREVTEKGEESSRRSLPLPRIIEVPPVPSRRQTSPLTAPVTFSVDLPDVPTSLVTDDASVPSSLSPPDSSQISGDRERDPLSQYWENISHDVTVPSSDIRSPDFAQPALPKLPVPIGIPGR